MDTLPLVHGENIAPPRRVCKTIGRSMWSGRFPADSRWAGRRGHSITSNNPDRCDLEFGCSDRVLSLPLARPAEIGIYFAELGMRNSRCREALSVALN